MNAGCLAEAARGLFEVLEQTQTRIVFAESCSGGLVAASLASIPGISRWLCGSAVTYQDQIKIDWLGVAASDLQLHSAVSPEVTLAMARGALRMSSPAELAVAVSGHLGPGAPDELEGTVFIAAIWRGDAVDLPQIQRLQLATSQRVERQQEAAQAVLKVSIDGVRQRKLSFK